MIHQKIHDLNICIIIPTYNNERTLERVLKGVLEYTQQIIVVNDGATDTTPQILENYVGIVTCINLPENKGKGNALRIGFNEAYKQGFTYAITIDSDGQHFSEDIEVFVTAIEKEPNSLLIGDRNMSQDGIPKKSSFGNNFSNFWYKFETGISLSDTQSGYRLYPLKSLANLTYFTTKFEFEIEVIVRAAWKGIKVKNIPIQVLYDESERVSHFRPFKDFTRISILNTALVLIAILYIKPRDYFRKLKKKGVKTFFLEDFLKHTDSNKKKALSMALGVFIGASPFWGFHTALVIALALMLRLNKVIAFAFSNISIPPCIPFIVFGGIQTGAYILGHDPVVKQFNELDITNFDFTMHLQQYLVGSFSLAFLLSIFTGLMGYLFLVLVSKLKK